MKLLAIIDEAKRMAMLGASAHDIATELDLHPEAARRIVRECEAHKRKLANVMEAS